MQPLLPFAGAKGVGMEKAGEWRMYLRIATCILHDVRKNWKEVLEKTGLALAI